MDKQHNNVIRLLFLCGITILLLAYFMSENIHSNINRIIFVLDSSHTKTIEGFIASESYFGGLAYFVTFLIVQAVIAPFKESYIIMALINLYGPLMGKFLALLGLVLGAIANFSISRLILYPFFQFMLKKLNMSNLPEKMKPYNVDTLILIAIRLLLFSIQDYISYAIGVTNMKLFQYVGITFICTLVRVIFI